MSALQWSSSRSEGRVPRVSVVIPAYNAQAYIETALHTVLHQTFTNFEIIVVNDGSQDQTGDIVRQAARKDPRIRLIEQANGGIAAARNHGLRVAHGEFIAFLDQDDRWHPQKLQLQVGYMDAAPDVAVVTCYSAIIDPKGHCLGWRFGGHAHGAVYCRMLQEDLVAGGSVPLVRRSALHAVGPFDGTLSLRCDWDMWLRLARTFEFSTIARPLVGYTRRPDSMSHDYEAMAQTGAAVLDKRSREDPDFGDSKRRFCLARDTFAIVCLCFIDDDVRRAWAYLYRSLSITPRPVLRSPRRLGVVAALLLATVLPRQIFQLLFKVMSRFVFNLTPGQPFQDL